MPQSKYRSCIIYFCWNGVLRAKDECVVSESCFFLVAGMKKGEEKSKSQGKAEFIDFSVKMPSLTSSLFSKLGEFTFETITCFILFSATEHIFFLSRYLECKSFP
jgi:hypothetical protein